MRVVASEPPLRLQRHLPPLAVEDQFQVVLDEGLESRDGEAGRIGHTLRVDGDAADHLQENRPVARSPGLLRWIQTLAAIRGIL